MTSPYIKNKLLDLYKLNIFGYLIKYLENTSLKEKQDKLQSITNNSYSFVSYPKNEKKYYFLEDVLSYIAKYIKNKKCILSLSLLCGGGVAVVVF